MEQPKINNTEEIKQKTPELQEVEKEISIDDIDKKLDIEEGILNNLNKFSKDEIFKEVDFEGKINITNKVDDRFDEDLYHKAGWSAKISNFCALGFRKESIGVLKSKERGLLDKDFLYEDMLNKEIEVGQNKEERSSIEKMIENRNEELGPEDLGKRQITKRFEVVDEEIIKIVQASRTEQGMLDEAGRLLNEKIGNLEKSAGTELIKEKEGLEKHYFTKEKVAEMTKYLSLEAKEEINKKISQEGADTQERIKEKEENLKSELDFFRIPFQERLDKTSEIVNTFSSMLSDTKEAENKYNNQLKNINMDIQQAQKSGLLEESKKEVVKELEFKKMEFEEKAKEFKDRKDIVEAKLGQMKINKTELDKVLNKLNGIGKTKKEITAEKTAKEEGIKKPEKNIPEMSSKEEKKETTEKRSSTDLAEDWRFMGEKEKEVAEKEKTEYSVAETEDSQHHYNMSMPKEVEKVKAMIKKRLLKKGANKLVEKYKEKENIFVNDIITTIKFALKSEGYDHVYRSEVLEETDKYLKKIKIV